MLILDLKECTHLFGSTSKIIQTITNHFKKINISVLLGLGENITIAKASVYFNKSTLVTKNNIRSAYYSNNVQDINNNVLINFSSIMPKNDDLFKTIPVDSLELSTMEKEKIKYLGI